MSVFAIRGFAGHLQNALLIAGLAIIASLLLPSAFGQSELATVFGRVTDPSGAVLAGAEVEIRNVETSASVTRLTNSDGLYSIPSLHPGHYLISVRKAGFKTVTLTELTLNVQDNIARNFQLQVGSISESITVTADSANVNTTDGTVSTVVDRQFAENLPLNGRSFQSLIELTPGVVVTPSLGQAPGQFSVNGQRADANYWMVDGVGANIGIGVVGSLGPGNALGGSLGSFSAAGGTNSLVSVDALEEFRVQTSAYSPEFGRTPGGQISILTRSGTNSFHGTAFDYLRNDVLDAADWFNGFCSPQGPSCPLPKARERQNDFGGTLGGPIFKDRTFFFFSYEGLRLRLPQTSLTTVPCDSSCAISGDARAAAIPAMQPFLNAFPRPNGIDHGDGTADFNATYSNPASLDAASLRVDERLTQKLSLFARYNYSPSSLNQRGLSSLATVNRVDLTTQTTTAGATWLISPAFNNDVRFNYSHTTADGSYHLDNFGGAVPLSTAPFANPFTLQNGQLQLGILSLTSPFLLVGPNQDNAQRQINLVDTFSAQKGSHSLKFGVDYRRLTPVFGPASYQQIVYFGDVPSAESGSSELGVIERNLTPNFLFRNLGLYAMDVWRVAPRFTVTYGVRWDIDFVPETLNGPELPAVTGFNLADLSNVRLAPAGTPPYNTTYGNVAPRLGIAYQLTSSQNWQTVLRGGTGVFYDLASSEVGNQIGAGGYPYGAISFQFGAAYPFANPAPPQITPPNASNFELLSASDPHLKLPYTLQWDVALEQALGGQQSISVSYIGAGGRRLLQSAFLGEIPGNQNLSRALLVANTADSDYNSLQVQFQRRLAHGLQTLISYTWAHSIDDASLASIASSSDEFAGSNSRLNRGSSDFDIRSAFSAAVTYVIPAASTNRLAREALKGWSIESVVQARTAPPVDILDANYSFGFSNGLEATVRPDVISGVPLYLSGSQFPGGKRINPNAFQHVPADPSGLFPVRQGDVPRNFVRGFGAAEWDFGVLREFPIMESLKLQFRAEMFNLLNHPNFGPPNNNFGTGSFGLSSTMLGQYLEGNNLGGGGFSSLYQFGGPRSIQLALKLVF